MRGQEDGGAQSRMASTTGTEVKYALKPPRGRGGDVLSRGVAAQGLAHQVLQERRELRGNQARSPLSHCSPPPLRGSQLVRPPASARREWLDTKLVPFAKDNPQIDICVSLKNNRHPHVKAAYLNDPPKVPAPQLTRSSACREELQCFWQSLSLKNMSAPQVDERISFLRNSRPVAPKKWDRVFRTSPSIQGQWQLGQTLTRPHLVIRAPPE